MLFKLNYPPYTIIVVYILAAIVNVAVCQVLLKKLIHFDVKRFFKVSYLKILYVVVCVSPLFLIKNLYEEGVFRFVFMSLAALIWFAIAVYVFGTEKKERVAVKSGLIQIYSKFSK
jgi:predicted membrane channel-forming protein YqfA (hemolysin III family)